MFYYKLSEEMGGIYAAASDNLLKELWFVPQKPNGYLGDLQQKALPIFSETAFWLKQYFSGEVPNFLPKLDICGTPFQKSVYDILLQIPYGKTFTYKQIAQIIAQNTGKKMAPQAVGGAVGSNPISIIIPCHRVIGTNGTLTGYAGGLALKKELLHIEKISYKE